MVTILNYRDINLDYIIDKKFNSKLYLKYDNNLFFFRTCYLTIESTLKFEDNKYYIVCLINDVNTDQNKIFLEKMIILNDKIKELSGIELLTKEDNIYKIKFYLKQDNNLNTITKIYTNNEYTNDFKTYLQTGKRISLIVLFNNIDLKSNSINIEILEIQLSEKKEGTTPSEIFIKDNYIDAYNEIDKELSEINYF